MAFASLAAARLAQCGAGASAFDANSYGAFVRDPDGNKIEAVSFLAK
jgi:hypothetical protein